MYSIPFVFPSYIRNFYFHCLTKNHQSQILKFYLDNISLILFTNVCDINCNVNYLIGTCILLYLSLIITQWYTCQLNLGSDRPNKAKCKRMPSLRKVKALSSENSAQNSRYAPTLSKIERAKEAAKPGTRHLRGSQDQLTPTAWSLYRLSQLKVSATGPGMDINWEKGIVFCLQMTVNLLGLGSDV